MESTEFFEKINSEPFVTKGGFDFTAQTLEYMVESWIDTVFDGECDINSREACCIIVNILQNIQKMPDFTGQRHFLMPPKENNDAKTNETQI